VTPEPGLLAADQTFSLLCVPVKVHREMRGVLVLARQHPFSAPDSSALEDLAQQIASALQRVDGVALRFGRPAPGDPRFSPPAATGNDQHVDQAAAPVAIKAVATT
jgi:hypothetical protein